MVLWQGCFEPSHRKIRDFCRTTLQAWGAAVVCWLEEPQPQPIAVLISLVGGTRTDDALHFVCDGWSGPNTLSWPRACTCKLENYFKLEDRYEVGAFICVRCDRKCLRGATGTCVGGSTGWGWDC